MNEKNPKIVLGVFSVFLGMIIAVQMKAKLELYVPVTLAALQTTKQEIEATRQELNELRRIAEAKEEELELLASISQGDINIINYLEEDIFKNKMAWGEYTVKGPGVVIKMYDNNEVREYGFDLNNDVIHDIDILNIINDLKLAGAEAISINDERLLSRSEIKCGGPIIRINDRSSGTPFVIKAIGDPNLLIASVNAPGTNGDILKNVYGKGFETAVKDELTVYGYDGRLGYRYAKVIGEGD